MEAARVLVINAGSSSLKFKVFAADTLLPLVGGLFDRIGDLTNSTLIAKGTAAGSQKPEKWELKVPTPDHTSAMETMLEFLSTNLSRNFKQEVCAVGHRVVHGGELSEPTLLTGAMMEKVKQAAVLAPLHNPPGITGVLAAKEVFKGIPQVSCTDLSSWLRKARVQHNPLPACSCLR